MLNSLRSVLEMADIHHSLHPYDIQQSSALPSTLRGTTLARWGKQLGTLCQPDGQVDESVASPKVAEYGGDWYVLYWPDVIRI